MKWSIVGLLFCGVVAALCAAVLVKTLRADRGAVASTEVEILVAAKDLPRSRIVEGSAVLRKTVRREEAPEGHVSNVVQAVGKVLAEPMVEGQAFTKRCFATGPSISPSLPRGMRAVTLSLLDYAGLYGLLHPGDRVDVATAFKMPSRQGPRTENLAKTLLQSIQVLAVEDDTVMSSKEPEQKETKTPISSRVRRLLITLMVTPEQGNALLLAVQQGTVALALRNPLDEDPVSTKSITLSGVIEPYAGFSRAAARPGEEMDAMPVGSREADDPIPEPEREGPRATAVGTAAAPQAGRQEPAGAPMGPGGYPVTVLLGPKQVLFEVPVGAATTSS